MNQTQTRSLRKKVLSLILAVVMAVSLLPISAFASGDSKASTTGGTDYYKILHLDCGRKYFSKDWIIALLNEMSADGYNQLQLAFGNDGLRFLLNDMSFTANGTTYSHETVVSKVEAGNKLQNSSGDARWLTQSEMDEIISAADKLGIAIVPLLNLPGHANAILDIADDKYNASGSNNTLNVANSEEACNFGMAIFKKYVDYFAGKGCKFFNFGADEYANDASGTFSFGRLESTEYATFVSFINSLASYIENKGMTPRAFNDGLYYNGQSANINTNIQCCYWSPGWNGYNLASASAIANKHAMINTNGDYYYVLGKDDKFDSGYSYAANFEDTTFPTYNRTTSTWGTETVSNPAGSMFCIWSDYPNEETEQVVAQKVRLPMRAMALRMDGKSINGMDTSVVANGFNADGTLNRAATGGDNTYTSEVDITLTVGQTKTYTQAGDVTDKVNKDGFNETVASIDSLKYTQVEGKTETKLGDKVTMNKNGTYTGVISDGTNFVVVSNGKISTTTEISEATKFTVVRSGNNRYTINGNGAYLAVEWNWGYQLTTSTSSTNWNYDSTNGGFNSSSRYLVFSDDGWTISTSSAGAGYLYATTTSTTPATNATQITFKGNAVGETSVIIGSVKYNITVVPEDIENVTPLKLEYWITNASIDSVTGADSESRNKVLDSETYKVYFTNIAAKVDGVASADGVDVTKFAPANTSHDNRTVYYWRCRMLDTTLENNSTSKTERQTGDGGDDETMSGVGFTKIRYYGSNWQVFTENNEWVTVDTDKNQLIAYYLEYIKVSDEVESFAADWGNRGDGSKGGWLDTSNYCTLSMQVVYEDGTTNPTSTTASALKSKTIVYGYWNDKNGRGIGTILLDGQEYEIYKVTSETGEAAVSFSGDDTATAQKFTWDDNEMTVWEGDPSSNVSIHNDATGFSKDGVNANLCWDENKEAILLRVYVRAKVTEDSLTVNYYDESDLSKPFYDYNISVKKGTEFDEGFARTDDGKLVNNTVTNIKNVQQTVQWDLSQLKQIDAQYRYSDYEFTKAERSADGKTVNLYYKFNSSKTFVVDFGLPMVIRPADMNANLGNEEVSLTKVDITQNTTYANIAVDSNKNITYTLNKTIDGKDNFGAAYTGTIPKYDESGKLTGTQKGTVNYSITVIPATSVYYEDSFATFTNADGTKNVAQVDNDDKGIWTKVTDGTTQATDVHQALEALGGQGNNVYGYDQAYANSSKFSMGSATKVTVAADTYKEGSTQWPTATFTFRGTGFDVISLTDNTSGTIFVTVKNKTTGEVVKRSTVNNYYGYKYEDGKWVTTTNDPNCLYQIPVMKIAGLDYAEYEVTIQVAYASFLDEANAGKYSFWLDAIRVYDPMDKDNATYEQDNEGYPQYIKLHNELVKNTAQAKNTLFIDGAAEASVSDYTSYGPNNEVYLLHGQAISFKLTGNLDKIASVQIGAKSPNGTDEVAKISVNSQEVKTATEMYYAITDAAKNGQQVTIANDGAGILSLTNLKITYTESGKSVSLAPLTTADQASAVAQVRALFAEPVEPFNPDRFEASWGHSVRKGETAALTVKTSEDVESITVDGQTIDKYVTRTERTGWGWWAKTVTYREFTYTDIATVTKDYTVCAVNGEGVSSDAITATLTVRPSVRDWLHGIIGKWF